MAQLKNFYWGKIQTDTASFYHYAANGSSKFCKYNINWVAFENQRKTGPNIPVRYPSLAFSPALKSILERFDFVKLSGFSGWGQVASMS